jgi:DNA-binding response OmpR family regulator
MTNPVRILLVDDNPNEGFLLEDALTSVGWPTVITHYHGLTEATSQLQNHATDDEFDVILLDYNLPGSSLEEVLKTLRTLSTTSNVPMLVVSVISREYDRERLLEAGIRGILIKPATIAEYGQFAADMQAHLRPHPQQQIHTQTSSRRTTTENFRPAH